MKDFINKQIINKKFAYLIIWMGCAYAFLYFGTARMLELNRNSAPFSGVRGVYLSIISRLVIFIILGILAGSLGGILKKASVTVYLLATLFTLYFGAILLVYYFIPEGYNFYPKWVITSLESYLTPFGCISLGSIIISVFRELSYRIPKIKVLDTMVKQLVKYKWQLLASLLLVIAVTVISYKPPQEKVIENCIELLYSVPDTEYIDVVGDDEKRMYEEICNENMYGRIVESDLYRLFAKASSRGGYTIKVKNLELNDAVDLSTQGYNERRFYNYEVELLLTYEADGHKETIYEEGSINVEKKSGQWLVSHLGFKDLNEVFK